MLFGQIEELDQKPEHIAVNSPNSLLKGYYGERFVTNETIPGHTYGAADSSDWDVYSDDEGRILLQFSDREIAGRNRSSSLRKSMTGTNLTLMSVKM